MTLFFESDIQSICFLRMVPIGFLAALCLASGTRAGVFRALMDILLLLLGGGGAVFLLVSLQENGLRLYHYLGLMIGAILYTEGFERIVRCIHRKCKKRNPEKRKAGLCNMNAE